jgi:GNAT superfamily N-acetyltransferase
MPEIEIRPATSADKPYLLELEHDYSTDYVWQMDVKSDEGQVQVNFKEVRLPRSMRVEYPRSQRLLGEDWAHKAAVLAAVYEGRPVGYISIAHTIAPRTNWVTDLVVMRRLRRQGIGTALVLASQEWALQFNGFRMVMEMQPKNFPAIQLAQKLGFNFCGFNDRYYPNHDTALFFSRSIR